MREVAVRELRNYGGQILDRVEAGESVIITRDGKAVAQLVPLPRPRLSSVALIEQWRNVPVVDLNALRADLTEVMDADL